jgi:hypothetical protein
MEWFVIGIVLALAMGLFGVPYALLFKPWRVKPLYRFLYVRSAWYRRWMWRRHIAVMKQMTKALSALVPATKKAAESMRAFAEVCNRPEIRAALAEADRRG